MSTDHKTTLDDALIALQKTFSRVSERSASRNIQEGKARALMVDTVTFELSLNVDMDDGAQDYIHIDKLSPHSLKLKGEIELDIDVRESGEGNDVG